MCWGKQSFMSQYDRLVKPLLTKQDEEFQMLLEVAEEYSKQKRWDTPQNKSGNATEIVIRNHLLAKGFNMTLNPNVVIQGSTIRNDSLLLKPNVDPRKHMYATNEVDTVIEIKNNAVANQSNIIKENFDELRGVSENFRFAAIVLSERKGYTHEITDEKLEDPKYPSFTLVSRRQYPSAGGLYSKEAITDMLRKKEMKKTGDWERLIAYLQSEG
jgi:hypothetical protein